MIHLSEIDILLLETTDIVLSTMLIKRLSDENILVVFCDDKRLPVAQLMPYYGKHDSSLQFSKQIEWTEQVKGVVWTEIISQKIFNQAVFLYEVGLDKKSESLTRLYEELQIFDPTNREGHAARIYFNALFGLDFSRNKECFVNAALDYGYSIILSAFNREIISCGYFTQLGLCHKNPFNKFNLSSDFMEPFRILVDEEVYNMEQSEFSKEHKNILINILNKTVTIDDKQQTVANAIKIYCRSLFTGLKEEDLEYIKMYKYEL